MQLINDFFNWLNGIVWGVPMIVLILGTGLYLQIRLGFMPILRIPQGFRMIWGSRTAGARAEGEISPFAALMTALSATVGTGNIAGVATAIAVGGPGALFWMWMTAFVGMATKYAEVVVAVKYRVVDDKGEHAGGPMYAIRNGLGERWGWLAGAFAIFGGLAGFGIGNMVQANGISSAMENAFGIDPWITGGVLMVLTGAVVLGGIKRIGAVAEKLVPAMCIGYIVCCAVVLVTFADQIPAAFDHHLHPCLHADLGGRWLPRCDRDDGDPARRGARHLLQRGRPGYGRYRPGGGHHQQRGVLGPDRHDGHLHRHHHRVHDDRPGDHGHRRVDLGCIRRGADLGQLRGGDARRRQVSARAVAGGVRLHHHPRLGLLRREVLGVPAGHGEREALPRPVDPVRLRWARSPASTSPGWLPTR